MTQRPPALDEAPGAHYSLFLIVGTNVWGAFHAYMAAQRLPEDLSRA